jgi:hypothetical protein
MEQHSLNELFLKFSAGTIDRAAFEGSIYMHFIFNREKTCLSYWKNEEYEDYLSWFYPRLKKAIDSYKEIGSSFEAYMNKFMMISSREYRIRKTTKSFIEYSAWGAQVPDLYAYEESPDYFSETIDDILPDFTVIQNQRKNTKRILALVLKCYYYVSDDLLEKIASIIKIDRDELRMMIEKMRKIRQKKDDAIYLLKERIYCQYYRCIVYEKRLSLIQENSAAYNNMKLRLEKARLRLEKMRKRLSGIRTDATNKQVAEVIGIKKGTVDASLFKLKAKLGKLAEKSNLN